MEKREQPFFRKVFTDARKLQILQTIEKFAAERTENNVTLKHLLLCQNGITDEELEDWRLSYRRFGVAGLRQRKKNYLERIVKDGTAVQAKAE